ncbi:MAG TPA: fructose-6-phosphate aldolase [Ktedonobacterales bacterium]|jgi:transaldolase|nr:fructose-6-phosphate aldolase [Ktedonobacterales bacterium]
MRIFLDTADIDEIREAARWGILSGVTTNPTLMMKSGGKSHEAVIREIAEIVDGPISAETISLDTEGMLVEARRFAKWHPNVVVKVPSTPNGWAAVKQLKQEGIRTNVTLCFSANQALFAALAGAYIISPFVGRLDDISEDGMQVVRDTVEVYRKHNLPTLVLAASIRHPLHIIDAAKAGADIATVPFKVLELAAKHPLTDKGIDSFLKDWQKFTEETGGRQA